MTGAVSERTASRTETTTGGTTTCTPDATGMALAGCRVAATGGAGEDVLAGGEGEASVLELAPGIAFGDLRAERAGDDLTLTIRGSNDALAIADYFVAPQSWTVHEAGGAGATAEELYAAGLAEQQSREALKAEARSRARLGVQFAADAVLDPQEQLWLLDSNPKPAVHPDLYAAVIQSVLGRNVSRMPSDLGSRAVDANALKGGLVWAQSRVLDQLPR